jgi:hypothetical protein
MALSERYDALDRAVSDRETEPVGWYASTSEDVLARLSSGRHGLSADEAARRLAEHGPNRLTRQQGSLVTAGSALAAVVPVASP